MAGVTGSTVGGTAAARRPGVPLFRMYLLALGVCVVGNLVVRLGARGGWLPGWGQVVLAVLAALPLGVAAVRFWRLLGRDLDEMLQRVALEGMAFALVVYVPLAALYVNLRVAGVQVPRLDAPDIVLTPAVLVAVGIGLALRRYE